MRAFQPTVTLSALCCFLGTMLGACGDDATPATQALVVVHADSDTVANALTRVTANLYPIGATDPDLAIEQREFALTRETPGNGKVRLPFSFGIVKGEQSRFLLVLHGFTEGRAEPVIEQKLIASFQSQQSVLLDVLLAQVCYERAQECGELNRTCQIADGKCADVIEVKAHKVVPGRELEGFGGAMDAGDSSDSGQQDGGQNDAGPPPPAALGNLGEPCSTPQALACNSHNGSQKLVCFQGTWSPNGSCDNATRCDTRSDAPTVGTCQPVLTACLGKQPFDSVCDGSLRAKCGEDLLDLVPFGCPANATCKDEGQGSVTCDCNASYFDDGAGGCAADYCMMSPCQNGAACSNGATERTCDCSALDFDGPSCDQPIDDCALTPCGHGGACTDGMRTRTCNCANTGFSDPSCNTNINECAGTNVCSGTTPTGVAYSYPCVDYGGDTAGYYCKGQFFEWSPTHNPVDRYMVGATEVLDTKTGLTWTRSDLGGSSSTYSWANAKAQCAAKGAGWRLPTVQELSSIVDYSTNYPALDTSVFTDVSGIHHWTSTPYASPTAAWGINLATGIWFNTSSLATSYNAVCVK